MYLIWSAGEKTQTMHYIFKHVSNTMKQKWNVWDVIAVCRQTHAPNLQHRKLSTSSVWSRNNSSSPLETIIIIRSAETPPGLHMTLSGIIYSNTNQCRIPGLGCHCCLWDGAGEHELCVAIFNTLWWGTNTPSL